MKLIDFVMAVPIGIAITSLFIGTLFLLVYFYYRITNNNKYIINLIHILNHHYIIILTSSFGMGYGGGILFIKYFLNRGL